MKTAAIGAGPRTARKLAPVLERTIFRTSRLAEFCSTRELVAQTGHQIAEWSLVTLKELTDNAIDICEEKDIAPEIAVSESTEEGTITVADNGPAIPPQTIIDGSGELARGLCLADSRRPRQCAPDPAGDGLCAGQPGAGRDQLCRRP